MNHRDHAPRDATGRDSDPYLPTVHPGRLLLEVIARGEEGRLFRGRERGRRISRALGLARIVATDGENLRLMNQEHIEESQRLMLQRPARLMMTAG